jgi:hypothetical protein
MASNLYRYNFKTKLKFVLPGDKTYDVPVINKITKHFNYDKDFFPIYECDCVVPINMMTLIRSNQDSIYAILNIQKEKYKTNDSLTAETAEEILDQVFLPLFTKDSFSPIVPGVSETSGAKDNAISTFDDSAALTKRIKFALYSVVGLSLNKKILNYVADEADVGTMLKFLISKAFEKEKNKNKDDKEAIKGCIIDKPDNDDVYKNLIITPHNLNTAIKELQTRYGIYRNGLTCFFDAPVLYVLNKFSLNHDCESDKPNKLIFECQVRNPAVQIGISPVIENKDKSLTYKVTSIPAPVNQDISLSELNGNEYLFSNLTLASNMMTFEGGEIKEFTEPTESLVSDNIRHKKTSPKTTVDYDETNNPYNITSLLKSSNLGTLVTINNIIGIDPESFKPNSTITIKITDDDKKDEELSGVYSLLSGSITFERSNPDEDRIICGISNILLSRMDS